RPEQEIILDHLYTTPEELAIIIKARRLGLSTGIGIGMTDFVTFNGGSIGRLIERNKDLAGEKMTDIMRFAFLSMPPEILARVHVKHKDSPTTFDPLILGLEEKYRSKIIAGMSARGGDCSWLHVSEMGKINHTDPKRAEEIRTGALPAARKGKRVIETTWEGGKHGHLWDLVKPVLEGDKTSKVKIFFFPWHGDPQCIETDGGYVPKDTEGYFIELSKRLGRTFSQEQKRWYTVTSKEQGIFMKREYPSTLDEAFAAPVEGAIYAASVDRARVEDRIVQRLPIADTFVHTSWDLGAPQNAPCWMWQLVGREIHVIDYDVGAIGETITARCARLAGKGYNFGTHFFPHDAKQTERTGRTFAGEVEAAMKELNMGKVEIVPVTKDVWVGINHLLGLFPSLVFLEPATKRGLEALQVHHTKEVTASGIVCNEPVHDWSMHPCDALRTMAEAHHAKMFKFGGADVVQDADRDHRRPQPKRARMTVG
ncbi:MAG TPA: hypothetical protein VGE29_10690, partial [Prosthecobacter sp.]